MLCFAPTAHYYTQLIVMFLIFRIREGRYLILTECSVYVETTPVYITNLISHLYKHRLEYALPFEAFILI